MTEQKNPLKNIKNTYSDKIKTVNDLLRNKELVKAFKTVFMYGDNINRGHYYTIPTDETNDHFISLFIDLGLITYDWDELKKQTHRQIGNRIIEFSFNADTILDIFDRLNGKNAIIKKQTLEFISRHIGDQGSGDQLVGFFQAWGVPNSLIDYPNTKWRMINTILTYYATSTHPEDHQMLFKIIEEATHPLMYSGNKEKALEIQDNFTNYLQYDGYCFDKGKIVKATDELIKISEDRQKDRDNKPVDQALLDLASHFFRPPVQQPRTRPLQVEIIGGQINSAVKIIENTPSSKPIKTKKNNLVNSQIFFDDNKATISIDNSPVPLPPFKNEHYFCQVLFQHPKQEFVDWSIIFEGMDKTLNGLNKKDIVKDKRMVQDTMYAVNKRIREVINTEDDLFSWKEKSIKRNY